MNLKYKCCVSGCLFIIISVGCTAAQCEYPINQEAKNLVYVYVAHDFPFSQSLAHITKIFPLLSLGRHLDTDVFDYFKNCEIQSQQLQLLGPYIQTPVKISHL